MAGQGGAVARREESKALIEPGRKLRDGECPQRSGSELEGQRDAVKAYTHLSHSVSGCLCQREILAREAGAVHEELDRLKVEKPCEVSRLVGVGEGEQRHPEHALAPHAKRLTAGGEHAQIGTSRKQPSGEASTLIQQVLAVVKQKQGIPGAQKVGERVDGRSFRSHFHAEHAGHCLGDELWSGKGCQLHQEDTAGEISIECGSSLKGEPSLP